MTRQSIINAVNDYHGCDPHPYILSRLSRLTDDEIQDIRDARQEDHRNRQLGDETDECLWTLLTILDLDEVNDLIDPIDTVMMLLEQIFENKHIGICVSSNHNWLHFKCVDEEAANRLHDLMCNDYVSILFTYEVENEELDAA